MPFLIPALTALASDIVIIYLVLGTSDAPEADGPHAFMYSTCYAAPLAIIRLLLLFFPLPYHSFTGKAIQCPSIYRFFYGGTLFLVLCQMLGIMILDPDSLSTLVPTNSSVYRKIIQQTRRLLDHSSLHNDMPKIWLVLGLTLLSDLLHVVLFWHVRSTAPTDWAQQRHVLYFYTQKSQQQDVENHENDLEGFQNEHDDSMRSLRPSNAYPIQRDLLDGYDEFMSDMQQRFRRTKAQWSQRLDDFALRMSNRSTHGATPGIQFLPQTPFSVLLQLFAYEKDVLPQLDVVFDQDDGAALTFYVPQLLSFLLHGAFHDAQDLEEWILGKCRLNVQFAHRCYWFLRAWCLEGSHAEVNTKERQRLSMSRNNSLSSMFEVEQSKYPPEERSAMQALLQRVVECGEAPAISLHEARGIGMLSLPLLSISLDTSPSAVVTAIESGILPTDPITGAPSVRHLDSFTAQERKGLIPIQLKAPTPAFMETPKFLDALLNMADHLFLLPRDQRTIELRKHLRRLEVAFLPANSIYMPVNKVHHWVWRIVADESIALSTKERAPCIVALEVVDYQLPSERKRGFSAGGILDLMRANSQDTNDVPISPTKHLFGGSQVDEREAIFLWRTAFRNPRRFETLFDKVTSFTRDTARSAQETLTKFQILQQQDGLTWVGNQNGPRTINDEEGATLTSVEAPSTPTKQVVDAKAMMGQWSSPGTVPNSARFRGNYIRTSSGRLKQLLSERASGNVDSIDENKDDQTMDALLDIRRNMESLEGSFSFQLELSATGAYGATQKQRFRPPPVVFKESWASKEDRIRKKSAHGSHPNWRLLPILVKSNDDLRQEQLASQLIYRMASILAQERVPVWLCPYEIIALTDRGGIIEAIPDTISLDSLKRNDPNFENLKQFFNDHFEGDDLADAKANFVESLAAYSVVCFLLQIKDRHNGNILLDNRGHLIHIDFGFFFLSSPGKNSGFESAPFKLTADFVDLLGGPNSKTFRMFRELCCRTFLSLRKHCYEITLLVEMLMVGNEDLNCFRGRPEDAVRGLRERFRLDLNDRACTDYVNGLVDESLENWRTRWYDRYQRFCVGVL